MKRVIIKFMSHGKKLLAPNIPRTVHSLQGRTCPLFLKMLDEAGPELNCEYLLV